MSDKKYNVAEEMMNWYATMIHILVHKALRSEEAFSLYICYIEYRNELCSKTVFAELEQ